MLSVQNSNGFENIPPIGYNLDNMKLQQIHTKSTEYQWRSHIGTQGGLGPPKIFEKISIYIYSKVILIKKCYIHNIFTINLKWQVIIGCFLCAKKLFKLWIKIRTNNNLPFKIYCEIVVKIL